MYCEIIDCYFNVFFVEIQLKKENLKSAFWLPEFGCPNHYTGLPNALNMSLGTVRRQANKTNDILFTKIKSSNAKTTE